MVTKRVAIGGTFACDETLAAPLEYLLKHAVWGVDVDLRWLRYGSLGNLNEWSSDVLHPAHPMDLVLLLVRLIDLEASHPELHFDTNNESNADVREDSIVDSPISNFLNDLQRYDDMNTNVVAVPLVVLLCPCPPSTAARFTVMEHEIESKTEAMQSVTVHSTERLLALFQHQYTTVFYDAATDKRQHSPYTQAMLNVLSLSLCRQICRLFRSASNRKKAIVLDCDNTLWNGAVAEVGVNGIELAPQFLALQRFVVAQQKRGMVLMLCSKNIHADVMAVFTQRRNEMVLDLDKHVVASKINWQPKSENIAQLAKELTLGLDSFIFIDDNPIECHEVAAALPSVTIIPLETNFTETLLEDEWVFDDGLSVNSHRSVTSTSTMEDSNRTLLYKQNLEREDLRGSSATHKAFLGALGVKVVFEELDCKQEMRKTSSSFARALQLHHRTNQFNTATTFAKRLEEDALMEYVAASDHAVVCAHVTDRFGHYGLVSVALCQLVRNSNVLRIDSFLLSCRALNRGVEHAMTRRLGEIAVKRRAVCLEFIWERTERNQPAQAFFLALPDVSFVEKSNHAYTTNLSSSASGAWIITSDKASEVSFLQSKNSAHRYNGKMGWVVDILRLQCVQWLRCRALVVVQWIQSSILLPHWIACLLKPLLFQQTGELDSVGLLRVPLRDRGSLEEFLRPVLRIGSDTNCVNNGNCMADADDDKFRRKARHLTKLTLRNYTHERETRVIWSANRPYVNEQVKAVDDRSRETNGSSNDPGGLSISSQPICKSPQCSLIIQRDSRCDYQRCRNCCYRTQRLLTRSLYHKNADARQSASNQLQAEFAKRELHMSSTHKTCAVHRNKRRLGEMYKHKQP